MKMSRLFSRTLRDIPSEAEIPSHQLLLRAGFIRQLAAGVFSALPLAQRCMAKIEHLLRQEMDAMGGQEIKMPVVQPADLWKESGRWWKIDLELERFKDRSGRDMVLAMTHEEAVADLVRREIRSYRQLPQLIYHIQTKWRDDPRPRAGLIRVREFTMKDSYSLDADWEGLDRQYRAHYQAYFNIFHRCGLSVIAVKADTGIMGGELAHEFMYLTPVGEDTLLLCDACGYSANRQIARFRKQPADLQAEQSAPQPVEKVATPGVKTIEDLAAFLNIPKSSTAKAVFLTAARLEGKEMVPHLVFAVIRGDLEVNETKLAQVLGAQSLRPATDEEIRSVGAVPGYASPVGLHAPVLPAGSSNTGLLVVADDFVPQSPDLVAGANEEGFHLLHVQYGRDWQADVVADIAAARAGDACPQCNAPLRMARGVEVGNIFKLGTHFSESMGCTYLDAAGQTQPVIMGSYGIGVGRLLACIAEERHDEAGLAWPVSVAPYVVHMVVLPGKGGGAQKPDVIGTAERLYESLWAAGVETLMDERPESPGIKFNDADLIGLPLRLTVGERGLLAGEVELKWRDREERVRVPLNEAVTRIQFEIAALQAEIDNKIITVEFPVDL